MSDGKKNRCAALLTYYELARGGGYAILCAMNGFRITILALLVLVVGLMFYVVFVTLPSQQADYNIYQISQQVAQNEREAASHRERVSAFGEAAEQSELSSAYAEAEAADREAVRNVSDAEEQAVLAEARRRAEAEAAAQTAAPAGSQTDGAIGLVTNFNSEWVSIRFKPAVESPLNEGLIVAVRRDGVVLCEAVVDWKDEESGEIGATLKPQEFGSTQVDVNEEAILPVPGDEVIYSPYASSRDLRRDDSFLHPQPATAPSNDGAAPQPEQVVDEAAIPQP